MKNIVNSMFNGIEYWQDKNLLLRAIHPEFYRDKNVIIQLLGITTGNISLENEAKRDMWNHQITQNNMGDDILKNVIPEILNDLDFAKKAISKYNRTYIFLSKTLKASQELALDTVIREEQNENINNPPILQYMPEVFQLHHEIALMATTRKISNLKYAINLRRNKYFIIDIMSLVDDNEIKKNILHYIDKHLLEDKRFIAKLGCFDTLCEKFHNDMQYLASAVKHDVKILRKTNIFHEAILSAALKSRNYQTHKEETLSIIFRYIEKFHEDYISLNKKIEDKRILQKLFWEFGEIVSDEFL